MDTAFLRAVFLSGVSCCEELPSIAELQTANPSDNNFSEISELIFQDMKNSQFVAAPNSKIVSKWV